MSNIPTKEELIRNKAEQDATSAKACDNAFFERYKAAICVAMQKDYMTSCRHPFDYISLSMQQRLRADFSKSGCTLQFSNSRSGCTIIWS